MTIALDTVISRVEKQILDVFTKFVTTEEVKAKKDWKEIPEFAVELDKIPERVWLETFKYFEKKGRKIQPILEMTFFTKMDCIRIFIITILSNGEIELRRDYYTK